MTTPLFDAARPFRWRMGLRTLPEASWLQPDDARAADLAEKARVLAEPGSDALGWLEGSHAAASELLATVEGALAALGLAPVEADGHPIDTAGRSVQEDLCLLEHREGAWRLTAGSVCFPTRWSLRDKLGQDLAAIHAPVPRYAAQLGGRVERFLDRLAPGGLAWRLNWSLVGSGARRLAVGARQAPPSPAAASGDLHLRIERQTLRRLRDHQAVCFGIRIHSWPMAEVRHLLPEPEVVALLASLPDDVATYKDLEGIRAEWEGDGTTGRR